MNINQKNKVTWLTYPAFEKFPGIVHGFSTRLGGVSQGIYESMNLSFTRGDEESAVRENYRRLSAAMGFSMEDIVTSDQTHTTNVRAVSYTHLGYLQEIKKMIYKTRLHFYDSFVMPKVLL